MEIKDTTARDHSRGSRLGAVAPGKSHLPRIRPPFDDERAIAPEGALSIGHAAMLLASVCKLWVEPSPEHHAEACRLASKLHQALHDPETFKATAQL